MGDFISPEELATFLQSDVDRASAEQAIRVAESFLRSYTGQHISHVEDDEVTIYPLPGQRKIRLPQRPAEQPTVVLEGGLASSVVFRNGAIYHGYGYGFPSNGPWDWSWQGYNSGVTITYSHGYTVIPDWIKGITLQVAARQYRNPGGEKSETVGPYSVSREVAALYLTKQEKQALDRYPGTIHAGSIRVG